jgi:DNA ligase D-like protein (predicted 3'-phosphoesterase)
MTLDEYRRKRDFGRTPEPRGRRTRSAKDPPFVVQKHDASRLHYDLRLEVDGVLKSWALPRGPSMDPAQKRLAVPTEDHPLEYRTFEGVIPEGEYGGGAVIVWDQGTYRNLTERDGKPVPMARALEAGHVRVWLDGAKLQGGFALTRLPRAGRPAWLFVKMADAAADRVHDVTVERPESVISGRTIEEVAASAVLRRTARARSR